MKQPHVHAALIHAWADGAKIQYSRDSGMTWDNCDMAPQWSESVLYRIAPITIKYRKFLCNNGLGAVRLEVFDYNSNKSIKDCENNIFFIKWIDTEWQVLEVTK